MVIKSFHQLDEAQEEQIRELEEICNLAEKPALQGYVYLDSQANAEPDRDCFYLLYENGVLAGFLSVFAPGEEGEITAFVHPDYRRRGFFTAMLRQASREWRRLISLSLVTQSASSSVPAVVKKLGAVRSFSEYMMTYRGKLLPKEKTRDQGVTLIKVGPSDGEKAVPLLASLFYMTPEDAESWFSRLCASPDTLVYLAKAGNALVGTGCLSVEEERLTIFAVGVKKALRGRGYGQGILRGLMEQWEQKYKNTEPSAELDSEHPAAVSLFKKFGFETDIQFDYYRLPSRG